MPQRIDTALMMFFFIIAARHPQGGGLLSLCRLHGEAFCDGLANLGRIEINQPATFHIGQHSFGLPFANSPQTWAAPFIRPDGLQ